jgi:predicted CoA-substrate-specific enzyme activase
MKGYLGLDIGSISTKGVVIDENQKIVADGYLWTEGDPIGAVKKVLKLLEQQMQKPEYRSIQVVCAGTTGSARKMIGAMIGACVVKNEITAHAVGNLSIYPEVRTIFEIGGQDSKIILIDNGIVVDYAMNTLCAAGTGAFLSSQAHRLGVKVEEFGEIALTSTKETNIAARCTVFAESDLVHKIQIGHKKEDIIAGLCKAVVVNYLNNIGKGKRILPPIVFQGGVSKNAGVKRAFEKVTGYPVIVDSAGHLTGALGVAILSASSQRETPFSFDVAEMSFTTKGIECTKCSNHCEIICIYREDQLIDSWGNKCEKGQIR